MAEVNKLIGLKRAAKRDGWAQFIRTAADEKALLSGITFSLPHWDHFRYFTENFIALSKGQWKGKAFEFMPFQEILCGSLFGWIRPDGTRRFRRGYVEMAKKNSKALALDTKIPTPNGWRTMGEIGTGDFVFAADGTPTRVIGESEIFHNHQCFRVTFQNGEVVICDAGHLWKARSHRWRNAGSATPAMNQESFGFFAAGETDLGRAALERVKTAEQLYHEFANIQNPLLSVRAARSIKCGAKKLPIDPYVLGYWLGDGETRGSRISVGSEDVESLTNYLKSIGYLFSKKPVGKNFTVYVHGNEKRGLNSFHAKLRRLGVLNNKHIPESYFFSAPRQRMELLKGLLDSDGTISKAGQSSFCGCNPALVEQARSLAASLGIKVTKVTRRKVDLSHREGFVYAWHFSFFSHVPCFRLRRKLNRQKRIHRSRSAWRYIKSIERCASVPTKCITVEHPEKLFLVGETFIPTHNSTTAAIIGVYMFVGDGEPSPEVYNVANDREQAGILWSIAADMIESCPELLRQARVIRSTKRIVAGVDSWFAAWSSDQSSKDGPNAHCIIADELHEWSGNAGREMWAKIRYAGIARRQPLCPLVTTTAGDDRFGLCFEQHSYAKRILAGDVSDDFAYFAMVYGADADRIKSEPDFWKSEEAWRQANPAFELVLKKEDFEADVVECENDPGAKARFFRYRLGVWIQTETPWLKAGVWGANAGPGFTEEELRGAVCFAGLDLSSVDDFTAVSYVFPRDALPGPAPMVPPEMLANVPEVFQDVFKRTMSRRYRIIVRIYCPEYTLGERIKKLDVDLRLWVEQRFIRTTPGDSIDHEFIFNEIKRDANFFHIKELGYDQHSAAWVVQQLQKELPNVELFPVNQSMLGMSNATKALTMALLQHRIEHGGNPVLDWMAGNAVPVFDSKANMMLHKGRSKDKIDGIIATIIAFGQAELGDLNPKRKVSVYSDENFENAMRQLEGIDVTQRK